MASLILKAMKNIGVIGEPWTSPDGKVTIWNVKLEDPSGEQGQYSTMSKIIAEVGWSGDLELYTNAKGKDYVRQAPKEEQPQPSSGSSWGESPEKQDSINRAVALNNAVLNNPLATAEAVIEVAEKFYAWLTERHPELVDPFDKPITEQYSERDM